MPEWTELSKIALQGLTLVVAGIGLVFAICQLRLLTTTYNDFHEWNRRKAAQDAIEKYTDIQEYYPLLNAKFRIMEQLSCDKSKGAFLLSGQPCCGNPMTRQG